MKNTVDQFVTVVEEYNGIVVDVNGIQEIQTNMQTDIAEILSILGNDAICVLIGSECENLKTAINAALDQIGQIRIDLVTVDATQIEDLKTIFVDVETAVNDVDISSVFPEIRDKIDEVKIMLTDQADSLIGPIQDNIGDIFTQTGSIVSSMKDVRDDYFPYFKTATLVLGSFFVVVLAIFLLGVCCGSCSKRGGSMASTAATVLFSTNILLILLAVLLFILTTIMFTVGALSQKLLCKTLEEPAESELLTFVSPLISKELGTVYGNDSVTIDVADVIKNIHNGMALYPLLQLKYIYDIDGLANWREDFGVDTAIQTGTDLINGVIDDIRANRVIFDEAKEDIKALGGPVDTAIDSIQQLLASGDLISGIEGSIDELETISATISALPDPDSKLEVLKEKLDNVITNARTIIDTLKDASTFFTTTIDAFLGGNTMTDKINEILETIEHAFDTLMDDTSEFNILTFFNDKIIAPILGIVDDYVQFAIDSANNDIGQTTPLSTIYNATKTDICQEIVNPFNAGWDPRSFKEYTF